MARNIDNQIRAKVIALLDADSYVSANSIPVRAWADSSEDLGASQIVVKATRPRRIEPNYDQYRIDVTIFSITHRADDPNRATLNAIHDEVLEFADALTTASFTEMTNLTIDGVIFAEPADDGFDEDFQHSQTALSIFCTAT